MTLIRFPNDEFHRQALGFLAGRFSFRSWETGEMIVPENALPEMALEGIRFSVERPAPYEKLVPPIRG